MPMWRPDPTFYPSPKMAMQAPAEKLAFVAMLNAKDNGRLDALGVGSAEAANREGHRAGAVGRANRIRIAAYNPRRSGWNLCQRIGSD